MWLMSSCMVPRDYFTLEVMSELTVENQGEGSADAEVEK